jgi:hypothetical protein
MRESDRNGNRWSESALGRVRSTGPAVNGGLPQCPAPGRAFIAPGIPRGMPFSNVRAMCGLWSIPVDVGFVPHGGKSVGSPLPATSEAVSLGLTAALSGCGLSGIDEPGRCPRCPVGLTREMDVAARDRALQRRGAAASEHSPSCATCAPTNLHRYERAKEVPCERSFGQLL